MSNRGQISLFVIIGILIVAAVVAFFVLSGNEIETGFGEEFDPNSFMTKCMRDSARDKIEIMIPQGGFINPVDFKTYNDVNAVYICKNINFYEPCVMQYPRYITSVTEELEKEMNEEIGGCFLTLEDELEKRKYDVQGGDFEIEVILKPEVVEIVVWRDMQLDKNGIVEDINSFSTAIKNPLYDLAWVANEITRQEAKYCYFEYVGFMLLYNDFDIKKYAMSDSTKIYTIIHKDSGETMNIAIRGCAIPPGF